MQIIPYIVFGFPTLINFLKTEIDFDGIIVGSILIKMMAKKQFIYSLIDELEGV